MKALKVKRGQIYYADLSPVIGSEQGGMRPVVIIQNDIGNAHAPTTIAAAITSIQSKNKLPTHIEIPLIKDSVILLEQIRTIDKRRLKTYMGEVDTDTLNKINKAIMISLGVQWVAICNPLFPTARARPTRADLSVVQHFAQKST